MLWKGAVTRSLKVVSAHAFNSKILVKLLSSSCLYNGLSLVLLFWHLMLVVNSGSTWCAPLCL